MVGSMFIRRTQTRRTEDGKPYFSHRLVHAERLGSSVRQRTLLNLGRHFDIPQADWPLLCARINDALSGQAPLVADCPPAVEEEAQRIAAQLIARGAAAPTAGLTDVQPVDVDSLRLVRPRSVGVEQVGLWALEQLDLPALLTRPSTSTQRNRAGHVGDRRRGGHVHCVGSSPRRRFSRSGSCAILFGIRSPRACELQDLFLGHRAPRVVLRHIGLRTR